MEEWRKGKVERRDEGEDEEEEEDGPGSRKGGREDNGESRWNSQSTYNGNP